MASLFLLLASCHYEDHIVYNDHIVVAVRDIPVGTKLQRSDLRRDHGPILQEEGACLSYPSDVLGHKTLRPLAKGQAIHASDIEGAEGSGVPSKTPHPCPDNIADGWNGW